MLDTGCVAWVCVLLSKERRDMDKSVLSCIVVLYFVWEGRR